MTPPMPRTDPPALHWRTVCGRVGWAVFVVIVLCTILQVQAFVGLGLGPALGAQVNEDAVRAWESVAVALLLICVSCVVLAVISRRWVLFSFALVLTFIAGGMNIVRFVGVA